MNVANLDEESKALLRRIVERTAYRQLMAANIRGHGMKYVPDVEDKRLLASDVEDSLRALGEVETLYVALGGGDLVMVTRDAMEKIPYPYSRLELAVCLSLCDRTERLVAESYLDGRCRELGAIARTLLAHERTATKRLEAFFVDFCRDTSNRPTAQQFLNRWLTIALVAFGRPNTAGDQRAVKLELRKQRCLDSVKQFLEELKPFTESCGLVVPPPATLGVDLPGDLLASASRP